MYTAGCLQNFLTVTLTPVFDSSARQDFIGLGVCDPSNVTWEFLYNTFSDTVDVLHLDTLIVERIPMGNSTSVWAPSPLPALIAAQRNVDAQLGLPNGDLLISGTNNIEPGVYLAAIDGSSGDARWTVDVTMDIFNTLVDLLAASDTIVTYLAYRSEQASQVRDALLGLNALTGEVAWQATFTCPSLFVSVTTISDGLATYVAIACTDENGSSKISIIDIQTGTVKNVISQADPTVALYGVGDTVLAALATAQGAQLGAWNSSSLVKRVIANTEPFLQLAIDERGRIYFVGTLAACTSSRPAHRALAIALLVTGGILVLVAVAIGVYYWRSQRVEGGNYEEIR